MQPIQVGSRVCDGHPNVDHPAIGYVRAIYQEGTMAVVEFVTHGIAVPIKDLTPAPEQ